jgi:hypothetical protein
VHSAIGTLETSTGEKVVCNSDLGHGYITGLQTWLLLELFHGCVAHGGTGSECAAHSPGQPPGLLHIHIVGELGTIKAGTDAGNTGALIEPALGQPFMTIIASCLALEETTVEGNAAGLFTPTNEESSIATLTIFGSKGKSGITEIAVLDKVIKPRLTAFGLLESSLSDIDIYLLY